LTSVSGALIQESKSSFVPSDYYYLVFSVIANVKVRHDYPRPDSPQINSSLSIGFGQSPPSHMDASMISVFSDGWLGS
jgi:hypothetical protein